MPAPLVSILMPFRNTSDYLPECIQSIISQSYENWELLAVDDHSEDESRQILEKFASQDKRIRVLTNLGYGIIHALRTAYAASAGEYITRMDSDDAMLPLKLETLAGLLKKHGPGHIAIGQVKYFSDAGISAGYRKYEEWINGLTALGTNYTEIYKECVIPSPCWMVHRPDLDACDAFQPERYPEDYDLTFRFYEQGLRCIPCSEVLHNWRDYPTRTSRTSVHYAQNTFLDLKMFYFLKLDHDPGCQLALWGAGDKGKQMARILIENGVPFLWLCDNPNKIRKKIYGQLLLPYYVIREYQHLQCLISVANEEAQKEIRVFLGILESSEKIPSYFFC